ncbi:MAG: hypothetical protein ACQEQG_06465 [Bacillota bacterium]
MRKNIVTAKLILVSILIILGLVLMTPTEVDSANISSEILKTYNSLLEESMDALEAGNYLESKTKLDKAVLLLWNNSPLRAENVTFVKREAKFYGDIVPVEDKNYQAGDRLFLYLEPKNYLIESNPDGKYRMDMVLDTKLIFEDGTIVFHDPEFLRFTKESSQPNQEVKFDLFFNLGSGIKSGEYTIKNTLIDKLSEEKVVIESKFNFQN